MTSVSANQQGIKVGVNESVNRTTAKTDFGTILQTGATKTANVLGNAANVAAPFVPGGAVLSAAISGLGSATSSIRGGSASPGAGAGAIGLGGSTSLAGGGAYGAGTTGGMAATGNPQIDAQAKMMEMNQTFNMQYLALQQNMQNENRQFTTLSNVIKTKHDTAKSAISNIK